MRAGVLRRFALLLAAMTSLLGSQAIAAPSLADRLMRIDRSTAWTPAAQIAVQFPTFHPQGMVRIGSAFFVLRRDQTIPRAPGRGAGRAQPGRHAVSQLTDAAAS